LAARSPIVPVLELRAPPTTLLDALAGAIDHAEARAQARTATAAEDDDFHMAGASVTGVVESVARA